MTFIVIFFSLSSANILKNKLNKNENMFEKILVHKYVWKDKQSGQV